MKLPKDIWNHLLLLSFVLPFATCGGCGSGGADLRVGVAGRVTFDGADVENGKVTFINLAEGGSRANSPIKNGKYVITEEFGVKPGLQLVEIEAFRERAVRRRPGNSYVADDIKPVEQYLPPKYNVRSELSVEVTPEGPNEHNFELTVK